MKIRRRGIDLTKPPMMDLLDTITVAEVMTLDPRTVPLDMPITEVSRLLDDHNSTAQILQPKHFTTQLVYPNLNRRSMSYGQPNHRYHRHDCRRFIVRLSRSFQPVLFWCR